MGISTFGSFTQARSAIYASYMGLSVTGNNISNINTTGYTRQQLEQTSFRVGGADRYFSSTDIRVGNGVMTTGVSQLRDPYLDIRYRTQMSTVGAMDAKLGGLEDIQAVLDETGDGDDEFGLIDARISELYKTLQQIGDQTGQQEYDIQVRSAAEKLVKQFNAYANSLEEVYNNTMTAFNQDLEEVNGILTSIRDLNASIRKNEIHGDNALELKDERNLLIDKLSEYMKIDVTYEKESVGAGVTVDKLVIKLANANPDESVHTDETALIDGIYARQFSITQVPVKNPDYDAGYTPDDPDNPTADDKKAMYPYLDADGTPVETEEKAALMDDPNLTLTLTQLTDKKGVVMKGDDNKEVLLDDNDLYGALQSERELLTECGEFACQDTIDNVDESAATKRGIPYYQKTLDLLANQIAKAFNDQNQNCVYNENGEYVVGTLNEDGTITVTGTLDITYTKDGNQETYTFKKTDTLETLDDDVKTALKDKAVETLKEQKLAGMTYDKTDPDEAANAEAEAQAAAEADVAEFDDLKDYMEALGGVSMGKPLFSTRNDTDNTEGITAKNISISDSWTDGPQIVGSFKLPTGMDSIPTTSSDNIDNMLYLFTEKRDYNPSDVDDDANTGSMFNGTFQEMWVNIETVLGNDMNVTSTQLDTAYASSVNLDTSRMSVSSVDLNDEAMNLMQYSQSYNAACRLMTTLDSVLDKLINGTGN